MVDSSAASSASAYTEEQTKTRRGTYTDRWWSGVLWTVSFCWLHRIVSSLGLRESQENKTVHVWFGTVLCLLCLDPVLCCVI